MVTAVVKRPNLIIANTVSLTTTQSAPTLTLKGGVAPLTQNFVHNLTDVVEGVPVDGATLIYNSITNKYEVKQLQYSTVSLDGGVF
jgi:hypothetical protein